MKTNSLVPPPNTSTFFDLVNDNLQLQNLLSTTRYQGIWMWNITHNQLWISDSMKAYLAYAPNTRIHNWQQLIDPANYEYTMQQLLDCAYRPDNACQELRTTFLNKTTTDIPFVCRIIKSTNHQYLAGTFEVSDELQMSVSNSKPTESLFASKYESMLNACKLGGWEYNVATGELWCSRAYFDILGRATEHTKSWAKYSLNEGWLSLVHPNDVENAKAYFIDYLQNPTGIYQQVLRMQHLDGSWVWIWCRGKAIENKMDNNPYGLIVGSHLNITEQKEQEVEMDLIRQKALADNAILSSIINSPKNIEIFAINQQMEYMVFTQKHQETMLHNFGKSIQIGAKIVDCLPETIAPKIKHRLQQSLKGKHIVETITFQTNKQAIRYFENTYSPIINNHGSITGVTVFVKDITEQKQIENKNKENEIRYKALFTGSNDAIFIAQIDTGLLVDVNEAAINLIGYSKQELIGMHQKNLHPPEELQLVIQEFANFCTTNTFNAMECHLLHKSGHKIPIRITASNLFYVGNIGYLAGYFKDITNEKNASKKIARTENLLEQAEKIANIGSIEINMVTGERIWSAGFYSLLGYEPNSIEPSMDAFVQHVHPDDREMYLAWFQKNIVQNALTNSIEPRIIRTDGQIRILAATGVGYHDASGKLLQIVGVIQDITEKKILEKDVLQSHLQLQKLTAQIPIAIVQLQTDNNKNPFFSFVSHGISHLDPSLSAAQIMANPHLLFNQMSDTDKTRIPLLFKQSAESLTPLYCETHVTKTNGQQGWIKLAYFPEKIHSGQTTWYGYMEDITQQKNINAALELQNQQLRDVAWIQSHIVRAPLARLMALVNAFQTKLVEPQEQEEFFGYIIDAANELDHIVQDIVAKVNKIEVAAPTNTLSENA